MQNFHPKNQKIVCIDSDGTALDTMNIKHIQCFGPCFVKEWNLTNMQEQALARWNEINLYERTRGKNRFITLLLILEEYAGTYLSEDLTALKNWVHSGKELSYKSLEKQIASCDAPVLKKALAWSEAVNEQIGRLTAEDKKPFEGAEEFLKSVQGKADVAVVSSAGAEALAKEWAHYGLDSYVDLMTSQEDGSKTEILKQILALGYTKEDVLMIGDSFPDIESAQEVGVYFYPVLAGREKESWIKLKNQDFELFSADQFQSVQEQLKKEFYQNLNAD